MEVVSLPYIELLSLIARLHLGKEQLDTLTFDDWILIVGFLEKHQMLFRIPRQDQGKIPIAIIRMLDAKISLYENMAIQQMAILQELSKTAHREKLRFVLIKGLAFSKTIYNDITTRFASDIDILVDRDDLCKADYVARKCNFFQPSELFQVRDQINSGIISVAMLKSSQAPFLIRHRYDYDHVSPYFIQTKGAFLPLEIHDRIGGLSPEATNLLFWDTIPSQMGTAKINVLSFSSTLVALILFAYEDSEGILSNETLDTLGLKYYFDLLNALSKQNAEIDFGKLEAIGCSKQASIVMNNLQELFPGISDSKEPQVSLSLWEKPYVERLVDPIMKEQNALKILRKKLQNDCYTCRSCNKSTFIWELNKRCCIECHIYSEASLTNVIWRIPTSIQTDLDQFIFQTRVYSLNEKEQTFEARFDMFSSFNGFVCYRKTSQKYSRGGKATQDKIGTLHTVTVSEDDVSGQKCQFSFDAKSIWPQEEESNSSYNEFMLSASIYKNHHARLFHECFASYKMLNSATIV